MKSLKPSLLIMLLLVTLFSCEKEEIEDPVVESTVVSNFSENGSNDESARNEYDQSVEAAFKALENTNFGSRGADSGVILPCGVVKIDTTGGRYKIEYGRNCGKKVLSGTITAHIIPTGAMWRDTGTVVRLDYDNYTVKFEVNNQTLVFNGSLFVTNTSGGLIYEAITANKTIVHSIRGSLRITYDNGATREWKVFKRRTYRSPNGTVGDIQAELAADSGNVAEIGISKHGNSFVTTIPEDYIYENCDPNGGWVGPYVLTRGKLVYTEAGNSLTAEPGHHYSNNTISSPKDCSATGYKLTWLIGGATTVKFQYY